MTNYDIFLYSLPVCSSIYIIWDGRRKGFPRGNIVAWVLLQCIFFMFWFITLPLYFKFGRKQQPVANEPVVSADTVRSSIVMRWLGILLPLVIIYAGYFLLNDVRGGMGLAGIPVGFGMILAFAGFLLAVIGGFASGSLATTLSTMSLVCSFIGLLPIAFMGYAVIIY